VPAERAFGVLALWATLCVALLACAMPGVERPAAVSIGGMHAQVEGLKRGVAHAGAPSAPAPDLPASDVPFSAETGADPEPQGPAGSIALLRRTAWVARVPLWPADALHWQRLEPALRLNPGHAPPLA
jgi:hypothetical protein